MLKKITVLLLLTFFLPLPAIALEQDSLSFETMWPQNLKPCLHEPEDVAVDNKGNIYILDAGNYTIQKFSSDGKWITSWGSYGTADGEFLFKGIVSIVYHPNGYIYVSDYGYDHVTETESSRIQKFTLDGKWVKTIDKWGDTNSKFNAPRGMAVDENGNIYITDPDSANDEEDKIHIQWIYKFDINDNFITRWQTEEMKTWTYGEIMDVAVEPDGNILALIGGGYYDSELRTIYPVQRFTPDGTLLDKWEVDMNLYEANYSALGIRNHALHVDAANNVYMTSYHGDRIQVFSKNGSFIRTIGSEGIAEGQFVNVRTITMDSEGNIYATDSGNQRIQKLDNEEKFQFAIGCSGSGSGQFINPEKIVIGPDNRVYVADSSNKRVQIFEKSGKFYYEFFSQHPVKSVAVDSDGFIYVTGQSVTRTDSEVYGIVEKYASNGSLASTIEIKTGYKPGDDNDFVDFVDIVFFNDHLYVADQIHDIIYQITKDGEVITSFDVGNTDEAYHNDTGNNVITGMDIAPDGTIYIIGIIDNIPMVAGYDLQGNRVVFWGGEGTNNGRFSTANGTPPADVAVDQSGDIWVADTGNNRLQRFDNKGFWKETFGEQGSAPGKFSVIRGITFDQEDRLFVTESGNSRVQVFSENQEITSTEDMAIIVAGGGPYQGNTLWDATQICANMAYRTLLYQGFTKENIYFLSWDMDLDLDGNSLADDVDGEPSITNIKYALESWAKRAENLVVFMIDHGGDEQFRLGELELMAASDFAGFFKTAHSSISGSTILIYDACRSGSFIPLLASTDSASGNHPVIITSSENDENAYFTNNGTLSFSYQFWSAIGNGMNLMDAFLSTRNAIQFTYTSQSPLIDDNGNGIANEDYDGLAARKISIGRGTVSAGDIPAIDSISFIPQNLNGETSATISANNVIDADGILRVWAVITPPDLLSGNPDNPVTELPSVELLSMGGNNFQGTYNGFTAKGKYKIAVFAEDKQGSISLPLTTSQGIIQNQGDASAVASSDAFHIRLPCVKLGDQCMEVMFELDISDNSGLFYKLDFESRDDVLCSSSCAELLTDFDISVPRLLFNDMPLSFILRYQDMSQFIWELDLTSVKIVP
ncbi:exported hypothetical protein [Desulfamplus magnetovallimortis]|uniref:NHL repeat containing protein n=1 Tax=Desulfamplus magnetovallimortis TaxID=1246637 RepID=A0A1W1HAQ5_9BACT|nr:C13 family peptidase [Desulfamplus magnetovallimortis]SLM29560.1 exported hypothetical protein [Desulfamplus magnetovallimortis]